MSTVAEIQARLYREENGLPARAPWPGEPSRRNKENMKRPVRKVSYSAVAGIVTAGVLYVLSRYNIVVDQEVSGAIVLAIMTLVGYVVPLSDADLSQIKLKNDLR